MNFKPVLVVVILGSFLWGLLAQSVPGHYFATLKLLTAVPVWGYVVVTAADTVLVKLERADGAWVTYRGIEPAA